MSKAMLQVDELQNISNKKKEEMGESKYLNKCLEDSLTTFIDESKAILVGSSWDAIRSNLNDYAYCLANSYKLSEEINSTQQEIFEIVKDFLSPDENLDLSKLPDYEERKSQLSKKIFSLHSEIMELKKVKETRQESNDTDEDGNPIYVTVSNEAEYSNALSRIRSIESQITELEEELKETDRLIEKINDFNNKILPQVDSMLDSLQAKLTRFIEVVNLMGMPNVSRRLIARYMVSGFENDKNAYFYLDDNGIPTAVFYSNSNIYIDYSSSQEKCFYWDYHIGEFVPISIFSNLNRNSLQYGADQCSFKDNFLDLINDPLIWEEMQKYYPIDSFESAGKAMEFYERYFNNITCTGCGYAAGANIIFKEYENREEEFEKTFGFPMYSVDDNGNIDFNYELMQLKYFNFDWVKEGYTIDQMERGLEVLHNGILDKDSVITACKLKTLGNFMETYDVNATSTKPYSIDIIENMVSDSLISNLRLKWYTNKNDYVVYAGSGYNLYDMNGNKYMDDGGAHYMMITGFDDSGQPIVSSWGQKYILETSPSLNPKNRSYYFVNFK